MANLPPNPLAIFVQALKSSGDVFFNTLKSGLPPQKKPSPKPKMSKPGKYQPSTYIEGQDKGLKDIKYKSPKEDIRTFGGLAGMTSKRAPSRPKRYIETYMSEDIRDDTDQPPVNSFETRKGKKSKKEIKTTFM